MLVTLAQHVRGLRPRLAGGDQRQLIILDALAPQLVHLGGVGRPRLLLTVEIERLVDVEIRFLGEQLDRIGHPFPAALLVTPKDYERRLHVSGP